MIIAATRIGPAACRLTLKGLASIGLRKTAFAALEAPPLDCIVTVGVLAAGQACRAWLGQRGPANVARPADHSPSAHCQPGKNPAAQARLKQPTN
jgi:hypothetical protein